MFPATDLLFASCGTTELNPEDGLVVILRELVKIIHKLASMDLLREEVLAIPFGCQFRVLLLELNRCRRLWLTITHQLRH